MRTGRLIEVLSTNLEPVRRGAVSRLLAGALALGAALAFGLMLLTVGPGEGKVHLPALGAKLVFALGLAVAGAAALFRSAHPGRDSAGPLRLLLLALLAIVLACIGGAALGRPGGWHGAVFGGEWMSCLCCIPLFTLAPFAALVWALRSGAPTDLRRSGASAGLVAGAVGAAVYAFHCPQDSLVFIGVWYSLAIALCAGIGAALGPRLLRW